MRRSHRNAPLPPSAGEVEALTDDEVDAAVLEAQRFAAVASEIVDVQTGEEISMQGPLSDLQAKLRDLLDYDQIAEVRLALSSRSAELEKHIKKACDLGVREEDARRRVRLIDGSDTRFGLLRIFAPEQATEQRDIFFDPENPNGRTDAEQDEDAALAREVGAALDDAGIMEPATA